MIFLSTALATVALTQAALSFNWVDMLSYLFTIIMGIVFGILQMKTTEEYWRDEYLRYAKLKQDEIEQEERRNKEYAAALRRKSNESREEKEEENADDRR